MQNLKNSLSTVARHVDSSLHIISIDRFLYRYIVTVYNRNGNVEFHVIRPSRVSLPPYMSLSTLKIGSPFLSSLFLPSFTPLVTFCHAEEKEKGKKKKTMRDFPFPLAVRFVQIVQIEIDLIIDTDGSDAQHRN